MNKVLLSLVLPLSTLMRATLILLVLITMFLSGCSAKRVQRIHITYNSEPEGASLFENDVKIGKTPITVHYLTKVPFSSRPHVFFPSGLPTAFRNGIELPVRAHHWGPNGQCANWRLSSCLSNRGYFEPRNMKAVWLSGAESYYPPSEVIISADGDKHLYHTRTVFHPGGKEEKAADVKYFLELEKIKTLAKAEEQKAAAIRAVARAEEQKAAAIREASRPRSTGYEGNAVRDAFTPPAYNSDFQRQLEAAGRTTTTKCNSTGSRSITCKTR